MKQSKEQDELFEQDKEEIKILKMRLAFMIFGAVLLPTYAIVSAAEEGTDDLHVVAKIGDETIIFRDCDDDYDLSLDEENGLLNLDIVQEGTPEKGIMNEFVLSDYSYYYHNDTMDKFEGQLIEDGAKVYKLNLK